MNKNIIRDLLDAAIEEILNPATNASDYLLPPTTVPNSEQAIDRNMMRLLQILGEAKSYLSDNPSQE